MFSSFANRHARAFLFAVGVLLLVVRPAAAIKVLWYNVLDYPTGNTERDPFYRQILADIQPDLMVSCEMQNGSAATTFLNNVLLQVNPTAWAQAQHFENGGALTESVLFYRIGVLEPTGVGADRATSLATTPRITPRWKLRPVGYTNAASDFYVYGCHLKAANTPADASERASAAALIRQNANFFPTGTRFFVMGDMNLYTSGETAYNNFIGSFADNDGRCVDPLNPTPVLQAWSDNGSFALMHSQSPRTVNPSHTPGGVTGGLDDRFDFILVSTAMYGTTGLSYISGTYRTYGQDGLHFNNAVNAAPPNNSVPAGIPDALWNASDHIPVLLQVRAPAKATVSPLTLNFGTVIVGAVVAQNVTVTNTAPTPGETLTYTYTPQGPADFSAPPGSLSEPAGGGSNLDAVSMNTATSGVKDIAPALVLNTNSSETPTFSINATGTVLDHAVPSTDMAMQVLSANIDFGAHSPGGFTDQVAQVYNVGYDALQALLNVWDAAITGPDAARFQLVNSPPADVGGSPAAFTVHFDDSGAAGCGATFTAVLAFKTRDQQGLPGAINQADVVFNLSATIGAAVPLRGDMNASGMVDCDDIAPFIAVLLDPASASPTQFNTADMNADCAVNGLDIQPFVNVVVCP